jgi:hypothetical protein
MRRRLSEQPECANKIDKVILSLYINTVYNAIFFTDETNNLASVPPIGAYKCANTLRQHGYSCLVVNHFSSYNLEELTDLLNMAIGEDTKLVAFSTTFFRSIQIEKVKGEPTPEYPDLSPDTFCPQGKGFENQLINLIQDFNSKIKFLAGGTKVNANYNNKNINYVILGYGETAIINLMHSLCKDVPLEKSHKNLWGVTVIDDRYASGYNFVTDKMCWLPEDVVNHQTLPLEIARGCIFKCKFCSYPLNGKQNLDFVKCTESIEQELLYNYLNYGIKQYILVDDTFNDHEAKLDSLRDVVARLPFQPVFWGYHRLDLIATRPHTVETLYDIGVRAMYFGIESLNPETARRVGKGYDKNKQIETVNLLRKNYNDISLHGSFIIGLPGESVSSVKNTFKLISDQDLPLHSWQFHPLYILKTEYAFNSSDIEKNFGAYDYVDQGSDGKFINWKNNFLNFSEAVTLAKDIMTSSYSDPGYHIPGLFSLTVASMQHQGLEFDTLRNTKWQDFDFNYVEELARLQFLQEYKQKLFEIVVKKQQKIDLT